METVWFLLISGSAVSESEHPEALPSVREVTAMYPKGIKMKLLVRDWREKQGRSGRLKAEVN